LSPSAKANSRNGTMCPANKLVITPKQHVARGATFNVQVGYTGRPGVHNDGDGTTEGWFRAAGGSFVTTEPLGTEDWMPLNDHPTSKPTYDFYDTVDAGKVAICNGVLAGSVTHKASKQFPNGSVTWHWQASMHIASYLVESSIGNYAFTRRTADNGVYYYTVQDQNISAGQRSANTQVIAQQEDITNFESEFNGTYPFTSDGVIVGTPSASFEEEMQTMITFAGGQTDPVTLYHENMHQWWGDNVSEGSFAMTFFKEGLATLAEQLFKARTAETAAGGPSTASGQSAFEQSLAQSFKSTYDSSGAFWTQAPSNPTAATLFSSSATYSRPGAAYIALRQILGHPNFVRALHEIQASFGGASITERQLERAFARWLPNPTATCQRRLSTFFRQWFDTAYPAGGGADKPQISGPGLEGTSFYGQGGCSA
jgi:aminopeptidase N